MPNSETHGVNGACHSCQPIAEHYQGIIDGLLIDTAETDINLVAATASAGIPMTTLDDRARVSAIIYSDRREIAKPGWRNHFLSF